MRHLGNKAFTLIEVLTAVLISTMLFLTVMGVYMTSSDFYASNVMGQNLQRDAAVVLSKIVRGKVLEPGGNFRLSEATTSSAAIPSEIQFTGIDGNVRWFKLVGTVGSQSIVYHHPTFTGVRDETIYTAPQSAVLTLRFWSPTIVGDLDPTHTDVTHVYVQFGIQKTFFGKTINGSAVTLVNLRSHAAP